MATQPDSGRTTEQIVSQFLSKALHAILSARIPNIHGPSTSAPPLSGRQPYRKRDRWFHLALGDLPPVLDDPSGILPHGVTEPVIVDVILSPRDTDLREAIIERWIAQCEIPAPWSPLHSPAETSSNSFLVKRTYKKSIILLRSIYSVLRLLPAYRIFKMFCSSNQSYNYDLSYRISSFAEPFSRKEELGFQSHSFAPVETQFGQLMVSVQYRPSLSDFNIEISSLLPPMLITDYIGSPAADPMRAFPASPSDRGLLRTATSAPLRSGNESRPSMSAPASAPLFHQQNSLDSPTNRILPHQPNRGHKKSAFNFEEFKLSPPLYMSPTPSPPTFSNSSYTQSRLRSETAPVSIPGSKYHGFRNPVQSDPIRNFLPPPSPRSFRALDPSSQESPSDTRSFRKISDLLSAPKGIKDGRDDSGRFSSPRFAYSRSSSRVSDIDDPDFSYPFAVDDVDTPDSQTRSNEGKEVYESGNATPSSHKSQEAVVGALVHMLKNAPALREVSSETGEPGVGSESSFFMGRMASDAMDELMSYKEMKEMVVRTRLHE